MLAFNKIDRDWDTWYETYKVVLYSTISYHSTSAMDLYKGWRAGVLQKGCM